MRDPENSMIITWQSTPNLPCSLNVAWQSLAKKTSAGGKAPDPALDEGRLSIKLFVFVRNAFSKAKPIRASQPQGGRRNLRVPERGLSSRHS